MSDRMSDAQPEPATTEAPSPAAYAENMNSKDTHGNEQGALGKVPFAFSKCSSVNRKGSSAWIAECNFCGKTVRNR